MNIEMLKNEQLSERQIAWNNELEKINKITDGLGQGMDERIIEPVTAFSVYGFTTEGSCEGHLDEAGEEEHGHPYPWIEIYVIDLDKWAKADDAEQEKLDEEWTFKNFEQQRKMMGFLAEFYKGRETPFDARLTFSKAGAWGGFRVQSFGADMMSISSFEEKKQSLTLYRKEMEDFGKFLKEKYLRGE